MIEVGRHGDIGAYLLRPDDDANDDMALDIMRIEGDAYVQRLGRLVPRQEILDFFEADPGQPAHINTTIDNLHRGEQSDGWYWSVATLGGQAVSFALYRVGRQDDGAVDEISLLELHTHPEAQNRGLRLASLVALVGLRRVVQRERCSGITPVRLMVIREDPDDEDEHPYALYRRLSFTAEAFTNEIHIGGHRFEEHLMETTVDKFDTALARRVDMDLVMPTES